MKKLPIGLVLIVLVTSGGGCNTSDLEAYLDSGKAIDEPAGTFMPALDDLPDYENIDYQFTHRNMILFQAYSMALVVEYDTETFRTEKAALEDRYTFADKTICDNDDGTCILPEYKFNIEEYAFRVVKSWEDETADFPHSFGMIGFFEDARTIVYLYFYDFDLDYISKIDDERPMATFVTDFFDYEFE